MDWQGAKILLPTHTKSIKIIGSCPSFIIRDLSIVASNEPIVPNDIAININLEKDNIVSGTINNDRSGYLFLPIPYENGWSALVDGQKVEIIQADSGFSAIKLGIGEHEFEFKYNYPYSGMGVIISLLSVSFIFVFIIKLKRGKNI